jgi:hypothetical protein
MKTSEEHIVKIAEALADNTRVKTLQEIFKHRTTGCGDAVGMSVLSQPTGLHHIRILTDASLVVAEKFGRHVNQSP